MTRWGCMVDLRFCRTLSLGPLLLAAGVAAQVKSEPMFQACCKSIARCGHVCIRMLAGRSQSPANSLGRLSALETGSCSWDCSQGVVHVQWICMDVQWMWVGGCNGSCRGFCQAVSCDVCWWTGGYEHAHPHLAWNLHPTTQPRACQP